MMNIEELNPHKFPTTPVIDKNLAMLYDRLKEFQDACKMDFVITSGLRSDELQKELIKEGKTNAKLSKHLFGYAADVQDPDGSLAKWVIEHLGTVSKIGLWFEDFQSTKGWVHAQCVPPRSGHIIFIP